MKTENYEDLYHVNVTLSRPFFFVIYKLCVFCLTTLSITQTVQRMILRLVKHTFKNTFKKTMVD